LPRNPRSPLGAHRRDHADRQQRQSGDKDHQEGADLKAADAALRPADRHPRRRHQVEGEDAADDIADLMDPER
jgi:hypothetical protein